jgi:hypothetical protein
MNRNQNQNIYKAFIIYKRKIANGISPPTSIRSLVAVYIQCCRPTHPGSAKETGRADRQTACRAGLCGPKQIHIKQTPLARNAPLHYLFAECRIMVRELYLRTRELKLV